VNQSDLINEISNRLGGDKQAAKTALEAVTGAIVDAVKSGEAVSISGFGKFSPKNNAAREGRNPATRAPMQIAASKGCGFSAAKGLKDALNG
jgi:DNA-binding protein HU-beta